MVQLGSRIFVLGGTSNTTEEFNLINNTWSVVATPQMYNHKVNSSIPWNSTVKIQNINLNTASITQINLLQLFLDVFQNFILQIYCGSKI